MTIKTHTCVRQSPILRRPKGRGSKVRKPKTREEADNEKTLKVPARIKTKLSSIVLIIIVVLWSNMSY